MAKIYSKLRFAVAFVVGILAIMAFWGQFYVVKIFDVQLVALLQRALVDFSLFVALLLLGLVILSFLFGRIYCSILCPLGLYQEILMLLFRRKVSVQKNKPYKYFLAAIVFGVLIGGSVILARLIDPYALFGAAVSGAYLGLTALIFIAVLVWFKGRLFCTLICPVGTALGLISKHSLNRIYIEQNKCISCGLCAAACPAGCIDFKNKSVDNENCLTCFKCVGKCSHNALHYGIKSSEKEPFNPSHRRFLVTSLVAITFAGAVKGGVELAKFVAAKVKKIILPAGASSPEEFANRCLNCNLCVQNCPAKILKKADDESGVVHIDYTDNSCAYDCNKCSQICPSGAIKRLTLAEKQRTQIGLAVINAEDCVRCGLCSRNCPRQAVTKQDSEVPSVDINKCIGCGACKTTCPVKAITINPIEKQKLL